jgi:biopolymer transport protein ExbD
MAEPKRFFDVWLVAANTVTKEVPFHVVTDWVTQGKVTPDDRVKPSGTADWYLFGALPTFQPYFPQLAVTPRANDLAEALEPVEFDLDWKKSTDDDDDDVDMIPLIDISLVLLIFFMMTATVASLSNINVPDAGNGIEVSADPEVLRIDVDQITDAMTNDLRVIYSIGFGAKAASAEDSNLEETEFKLRLNEKLRALNTPPKVRVAAHQNLEFQIVEEVLKVLDARLEKNEIREYAVEVNERPQ